MHSIFICEFVEYIMGIFACARHIQQYENEKKKHIKNINVWCK